MKPTLTFREQLIMLMLENELKSPIENLSDERIKMIHEIADKLSGEHERVVSPKPIPMETKLSECDLPTLIVHALRFRDIETVGQLVTYPRTEIVRTRNLGKKSIQVIEEFLDKHNLKFADK